MSIRVTRRTLQNSVAIAGILVAASSLAGCSTFGLGGADSTVTGSTGYQGTSNLNQQMPPSLGQYSQPHTLAWAEKIRSFDGFVFVTPEYNHSTSGALKNAIDFLYAEWHNKAAGFVSYGAAGGTRAVEHLRLVMGELQVADVRAQVSLSLITDFVNFSQFNPAPHQAPAVTAMLDQVIAWSTALSGLRVPAAAV